MGLKHIRVQNISYFNNSSLTLENKMSPRADNRCLPGANKLISEINYLKLLSTFDNNLVFWLPCKLVYFRYMVYFGYLVKTYFSVQL